MSKKDFTTRVPVQSETPSNRIYSALPLDERMAYASEIADELIEESSRQAALICALVDACKKGRDANPDAYHLAEMLEERIVNTAQIERLQSCFPE